jgi:hypothetical protein
LQKKASELSGFTVKVVAEGSIAKVLFREVGGFRVIETLRN